MSHVKGFVELVVLCAMGDKLGSTYLNELLQMSRLLFHGNFSGRRENIPRSEWLLLRSTIFRGENLD